MARNNLLVLNTGLDHCYIDGMPIVEAEIDISEVYQKVARLSSLAVNADPYFERHSAAQKIFSALHGEGDRISLDFLMEGAKDIRPIFTPLQRLIPEGAYDAKAYEETYQDNSDSSTWTNPYPTYLYIDCIKIVATAGYGDITITVDGTELGTVSLPDATIGETNYLSYDLAGYLGGTIATVANYDHNENIRNNNIAQSIELTVSNASGDFEYTYIVCGSNYDAIGWVKALADAGDVSLPAIVDNIRIAYLTTDFSWANEYGVKVTGVTLKQHAGSANVVISYNSIEGDSHYLEGDTVGDSYSAITDDISTITVALTDASDEFSYDVIINTQVPYTLPSPRFEFDSLWNPGKIIFRYQNMDTRINKLNYTSDTLADTRVDPNIFDEVLKYLTDSLKNYMLRELYQAIGYDKKAVEYSKKYEQSRSYAKFWVRSEKGLQTQYNYAGV